MPETAASYSEAVALGEAVYLTGKPCKNGHLAKRRTSCRTCIECTRDMSKQWRSKPENKGKPLEYLRSWMAKPENREKQNASNMRRYKENPEPDLLRDHIRRARQNGVRVGSYIANDLRKHKSRHGKSCAMGCGRKIDRHNPITRDHIIALNNGGPDSLANTQWLCKSCNSGKRDRDAIDYARMHGKLL